MPSRSHPPHLVDRTWSAADGKSLPYERWPAPEAPAPSHPKAVLVCVHGLSGAASDFWPLGQELPKRGIVVYGMQVRGQGNDPDVRRRGDIRSAIEWQRDLREFGGLVHARHPDVPVFWLGESMGSLITMHAVAAAPDRPGDSAAPEGLIFLSPAVALREKLPPWKKWLVRGASHVIPGHRIPLRQLDDDLVPAMRITRDATEASQSLKTPHFVPAQSLRLLREVHDMMQRSDAAAKRLTPPVLVLYTPNDPVASASQVEAWFGHIAAHDKTAVCFPKDFHLILHDEHRWDAVRDIGDWVLRRSTHP